MPGTNNRQKTQFETRGVHSLDLMFPWIDQTAEKHTYPACNKTDDSVFVQVLHQPGKAFPFRVVATDYKGFGGSDRAHITLDDAMEGRAFARDKLAAHIRIVNGEIASKA